MWTWRKRKMEMRIALGICAGILLARVLWAVFRALAVWWQSFSYGRGDVLIGVAFYGLLIVALAYGIYRWRRRPVRG